RFLKLRTEIIVQDSGIDNNTEAHEDDEDGDAGEYGDEMEENGLVGGREDGDEEEEDEKSGEDMEGDVYDDGADVGEGDNVEDDDLYGF
ncbi:hypothetical protein FRC10_010623, partial [Ceratobasidium sp. 414]